MAFKKQRRLCVNFTFQTWKLHPCFILPVSIKKKKKKVFTAMSDQTDDENCYLAMGILILLAELCQWVSPLLT